MRTIRPGRLGLILLLLPLRLLAADPVPSFNGATPLEWSQRLARSEMARRGTSLNYLGSPRARWDYTTGLFSYALLQLAARTGDTATTAYAARLVESFVQPDGSLDWKPLGTLAEFAGDCNLPPFMPSARSVLESRAAARIPAGIFAILLGWLGIHKFILGYTGTGVTMLLVSVAIPFVTCGMGFFALWVMGIIGLIEGIIYLTKSDAEFVRIYVDGRREWF